MNNQPIHEIDGYDYLQILSCHQALQMKARHDMFCYCTPNALRAIATHWLERFKIKPKRSWKALHDQFDYTFGDLLKEKGDYIPLDPIDTSPPK
jgi:hypothetical protein